MRDVDLDARGCLDFGVGGFVVGRVSGLVCRPGLSDALGLGLLLLSLLQLVGKPVDRPPETSTQNTENEEVDAVGSGEETGEDELESTKGDVCSEQEGWSGAGGEDGFPEVDYEVGHAGDEYARVVGRMAGLVDGNTRLWG